MEQAGVGMARAQGLPPTPLPGIPGEMKAGNAASFSSSKALRGGKQLLWLREMDIAPCTSQCEPGLAIICLGKKNRAKRTALIFQPQKLLHSPTGTPVTKARMENYWHSPSRLWPMAKSPFSRPRRSQLTSPQPQPALGLGPGPGGASLCARLFCAIPGSI